MTFGVVKPSPEPTEQGDWLAVVNACEDLANAPRRPNRSVVWSKAERDAYLRTLDATPERR